MNNHYYKITYFDGNWIILWAETYKHVIDVQMPLARKLSMPVLIWIQKTPVVINVMEIKEKKYISKEEGEKLLGSLQQPPGS